MGEYFKPRRRKVGLLVLCVALVPTASWVRSSFTEDWFRIRTGQSCRVWTSNPRGFHYTLFVPDNPWWSTQLEITWGSEKLDNDDWHEFQGLEMVWMWKCFGFDFGEGYTPRKLRGRQMVLTFPHWSFAVPLTLLSAYLILSPLPRPGSVSSKPKRAIGQPA